MNIQNVIEFFQKFPVPDVIKKNIVLALARGLRKNIESGLDVPAAYFEGQAKIQTATGAAKVKEIEEHSEARSKIIRAASEAAAQHFKTDDDLANRALQHFAGDIVEQQLNRESVAIKTMRQLKETPFERDTDKNIDEDWLTQFWNLSATKSSEEVQQVLAKILAKEIIQPSSISPNTLMLLSVLTSDIGLIFQKLCNISIDTGEECFAISPTTEPFLNYPHLKEFDITTNELYEIEAMKLIRSVQTIQATYKSTPDVYYSVNYAGKPAGLRFGNNTFHLLVFTRSGRELRNLISMTENKGYTEKLKERFKDVFEPKN